ncbi:hypothetical protein [Legionella quinlivanii]|uniref:hypothetical protein n=1 Tax=Legionella quinlivanii TaxID=45073 RepID=UPI000A838D58|nr:hypothetical protein [Legionella quinlivanii]
MNEKKNNLRKSDFFDYFAIERLGINQKTLEKIRQEIQQAIPKWKELIEVGSYLC